MTKLIKEISRIFASTRSILHKVFKKITHGTSTAFKTVGATMVAVLTTIVVLCIFCMLVLIAIPHGLINGGTEKKTETTNNIHIPVNNPVNKIPDEKPLV